MPPARQLLGGPDAQAAAFFGRLMDGPLRRPGLDCLDAPSRVGDWSLRSQIGRGGTSTVYDAERETPTGMERGALKLAKRSSEDMRVLFEHEARLLASLRSPVVARLLHAGVHADGRPFLVQEFVVGQRVTALARAQSRLERFALVRRACRAVAVLHDMGVVHGDLKPDHVLVRGDGTAVLLDLGLAVDLRDSSPLVSRSRAGITPEFAAPEQILGRPVSPASDVYALGLVAQEVLTGRRRGVPWALGGRALEEMNDLRAVHGDEVGPPGLPGRGLASVLQMSLQAEPSRRYPTAGVFAQALEEVLVSAEPAVA